MSTSESSLASLSWEEGIDTKISWASYCMNGKFCTYIKYIISFLLCITNANREENKISHLNIMIYYYSSDSSKRDFVEGIGFNREQIKLMTFSWGQILITCNSPKVISSFLFVFCNTYNLFLLC